ncbi:MAG: hypothetical protein ACREJO_13835 [Phycisphaerales bacterium]
MIKLYSLEASTTEARNAMLAARDARIPWEMRVPFSSTQGTSGALVTYHSGHENEDYTANAHLNDVLDELSLAPYTKEGPWAIRQRGLAQWVDVVNPEVCRRQIDQFEGLGVISNGAPFFWLVDPEDPNIGVAGIGGAGVAYYIAQAQSELGMTYAEAIEDYETTRKAILSGIPTAMRAYRPRGAYALYGGPIAPFEDLCYTANEPATVAQSYPGVSPTQTKRQEVVRQNNALLPVYQKYNALFVVGYHNGAAGKNPAQAMLAGEAATPQVHAGYDAICAEAARVSAACQRPWVFGTQPGYEGTNNPGVRLRAMGHADRLAQTLYAASYGASGMLAYERHDHTFNPNDSTEGFTPVVTAADVLEQTLIGFRRLQQYWLRPEFDALAHARRYQLGLPTLVL